MEAEAHNLFEIASSESLEAIVKSKRAMQQLLVGGQRLFSCVLRFK